MAEEWSNTTKPEWLCDRFDHAPNRNNHPIIFDNKNDFLLIFSIDNLTLFSS